jgi:ribonuclease BN (tRNA processing enzyme)
MELTVLGSGTLVAQKDRSCAGYVLREGNGYSLLDCGPGCLLRMNQAGVEVTDISLVLISHFHWDHVAELPAVLNSLWLQREKAPGRLSLAGPSGFSAWLERVMADDRDWLPDLDLGIHELKEGRMELGSLSIRAGRSFHTDNSLSFRLENAEGTVLFYSGDMDYQESLLPLAAEADLALVECSWPQVRRGEEHLDPLQASRFAAAAGVRTLLLTHFYQEVDAQTVIATVKQGFPGSVFLAEDLRTYPISRGCNAKTGTTRSG